MEKITFSNKVSNGGATAEGKVTHSDINEIKSVVNDNATEAEGAISSASASFGGGIATQNLSNSAYTQVKLTNAESFSLGGAISTTYDSNGFDVVTFSKPGIYKFNCILYVDGTGGQELFLKAYKNGVAITEGDIAGVQLVGVNRPISFPFAAPIYLEAGDVITYYGKSDGSNLNFTINGGAATWELTPYKLV